MAMLLVLDRSTKDLEVKKVKEDIGQIEAQKKRVDMTLHLHDLSGHQLNLKRTEILDMKDRVIRRG